MHNNGLTLKLIGPLTQHIFHAIKNKYDMYLFWYMTNIFCPKTYILIK